MVVDFPPAFRRGGNGNVQKGDPENSVKLSDGNWHFLEPAFTPTGRIKPLFALVAGRPEHHPEGSYYLRFRPVGEKRQTWAGVGKDAHKALREQKRESAALELGLSGIEVAEPSGKKGRPLKATVADYLSEIATHKSRRTANVYGYALARFQR